MFESQIVDKEKGDLPLSDVMDVQGTSANGKGENELEPVSFFPGDEFDDFSLARKWTDRLGFGKYQYKRVALPWLSFMCDGIEIFMAGLLNYSLKEEGNWDITTNDTSILASSTFAGMMAGSIFSGTLADKFGRRPVFIVVSLFLFIAAFMTALSTSLNMLIVMRTLTGVFMGGQLPLALINAGENTPTKHFGNVVGFLTLALGVGSLYNALMGYLTLDPLGWRYFVAFNSIPCFIQATFAFFYPETPRYAEYTGDAVKMEMLLIKMATENNASKKTIEEIKFECSAFGDLAVKKAMKNASRSKTFSEKIQDKGGLLLALFERKNIRITLIHGYGWLVCSFNSYGLNLFIQKVLQLRGFESDNIYISTLISASAMMPATLLVGSCIRYLGIRTTLILSSVLTSAFALMFSMVTSLEAIRASSWLYMFFMEIGFASFYFITPVCFNSRVRGTALGFTGSLTRLAGTLTPYIFNAMITDGDSLKYPYIFVTSVNAVLVILILFMKNSDTHRFKEN